jgi:Guanylylate cyclase
VLCSNNLDHADETYQNYEYYQNDFAEDSHRVRATFQLLKSCQVDMILTTSPKSLCGTASSSKRSNSNSSCNDNSNKKTAANILTIESIVQILLHDDCIAIVLLDNTILTRSASIKNKNDGLGGGNATDLETDTSKITETAPNKLSSEYMGHYVILCGVSTRSDDVQSAMALDRDVEWDAEYSNCISSRCTEIVDCCNLIRQTQEVHKQEEKKEPYCFVMSNPAPGSDPIVHISPQRFESSWRANGTDEDIIFIRRCRSCHL